MNIIQGIRRKLSSMLFHHKEQELASVASHWGPGGGKVFCVGRNKTGTTSLAKAFHDLGYSVGNQAAAEVLYDEVYFERRFKSIVEYCKSAQIFQDVPFSYPYLFVHLDQVFPGSKFILTVRDDHDQWYRSITQFHSKLWGTDGAPPTADQLRNAPYRRKGFAYNTVKAHGTTDEFPYDKQAMIDHYNAHNRSVQDYFRFRPHDLLVLNVAKPEDYKRFVEFLGVTSPHAIFPRENVT